jgi:hypothetical protein
MNTYDFVAPVVVESTFMNPASGAPTDPTIVRLRIMDPTGVEQVITTASLTHVSTGVFSYTVPCLKAGVWYFRFEGTGACVAAREGQFVVTSSICADAA